jgi:hypothetical protein
MRFVLALIWLRQNLNIIISPEEEKNHIERMTRYDGG